MSRESAALKAQRYLAEGRLLVSHVHGSLIRASCRGDGRVYRLGHDPRYGWHCSCPARSRACAHLLALRLVCALTPDGERGGVYDAPSVGVPAGSGATGDAEGWT